MVRIFTTNRNGNIELSKKELKELLDEAYWDGYRANNHSWYYSTPSWKPYVWTSSGTGIELSSDARNVSNSGTVYTSANSTSTDSITIKSGDYSNYIDGTITPTGEQKRC